MAPHMDEEILDLDHCLRKEAEYSAKARATTDLELKEAYEVIAREYAFLARQRRSTKERPQ
jgi:hypothetical protein